MICEVSYYYSSDFILLISSCNGTRCFEITLQITSGSIFAYSCEMMLRNPIICFHWILGLLLQ